MLCYLAILFLFIFELILQPFIRKKSILKVYTHFSNYFTKRKLIDLIPQFDPILYGSVTQTIIGIILDFKRPKYLKWSFHAYKNIGYWFFNPFKMPNYESPLIICVPGLSGDINSHYVTQLGRQCMKEGWTCIVVKIKYIDFNSVDELGSLIDDVSQHHSGIVLLGVSMGGNIVCKYCSQPNINKKIKFCVSYGNCFNVTKAINEMNIIWSNILWTYFKKWVQYENKCCDFFVKNFKMSKSEYLESISTHNLIGNIKIPLIIINSFDDPLFTYKTLENVFAQTRFNKNIYILTTTIGGHIGWCKGFTNNSWFFDDVMPTLLNIFYE
jgi:predicted alpha/beta-fold hydrolase